MVELLLRIIQYVTLEMHYECPECGEAVDTGFGFEKRDFECYCGWSESFPVGWYQVYLKFAYPEEGKMYG